MGKQAKIRRDRHRKSVKERKIECDCKRCKKA